MEPICTPSRKNWITGTLSAIAIPVLTANVYSIWNPTIEAMVFTSLTILAVWLFILYVIARYRESKETIDDVDNESDPFIDDIRATVPKMKGSGAATKVELPYYSMIIKDESQK